MLSITLFTWPSSMPLASGLSNSSEFIFNATRLASFAMAFFVCTAISSRYAIFCSPARKALASLLLSIFGGALSLIYIEAATIIGAMLIGAAEATLFLFWQNSFSEEGSYRACLVIAAASAASSIILLPLAYAGFPGSPLVLASVAGCLSASLLFVAPSKADLCIRSEKQRPLAPLFSAMWKPILCVAAFGFVWEIVCAIAISDQEFSPYLMSASAIAQIVASAALVAIWMKLQGSLDISLVFQWMFPIMATGFLLMPFLGSGYRAIFACLSLFAFGINSMLMQVSCLQEHERTGVSPVVVLGFFAGFVYASLTLGFVVGHTLRDLDDFGFAHLLVLALLLVYGLAVIFFMIKFRAKDRSKQNPDERLASERSSILESLAEDAGLSARESEVFELLVKGRDLPRISEELFLSKNTVRTHMKSLYRKFSVHSKQELLDIVEYKRPE